MADVEINERLKGLVTLLHAVGIDGVDPDALVSQQRKLSKGGNSAQSSEMQIVELIKKLQLAQADSPEILAALRSPELRALASLAAMAQPPKKQASPPPSLDDVMDDDDNYPKIGPGYSDDVSVMSDLTTPTVMTKQNVMEEEFYRDVNGGPGALPPFHIGMVSSQPSRPGGQNGGFIPKQRNLVSSVMPNSASRRPVTKPGGAAAQRRLNYQQAMAKLQSTEYGTPGAAQDQSYMENFSPKGSKPGLYKSTSPTSSKSPAELPSLVDEGKAKSALKTRNKAAVKEKKGKKIALSAQEEDDFELDYDPMAPKFDQAPASEGSPGVLARKKKEKPAPSSDSEWPNHSGGDGWPAFEGQGNSDKLFVDSEGFFPSSEVFQTQSPLTRKSSKVRREGEAKVRKPMKEGERSRRPASSTTNNAAPRKTTGSGKKGRRASLNM